MCGCRPRSNSNCARCVRSAQYRQESKRRQKARRQYIQHPELPEIRENRSGVGCAVMLALYVLSLMITGCLNTTVMPPWYELHLGHLNIPAPQTLERAWWLRVLMSVLTLWPVIGLPVFGIVRRIRRTRRRAPCVILQD